jgi:PIN domain nuclease of toxin-antitoxin system
MRLLLDTCILYDWLMGAFTDAASIRTIERDGALVSAVSVWEMAIKHGLGKLPLPSCRLVDDITAQGFTWLDITPAHAQAVLGLPALHRDPFDRLLIAQGQCEGLRILTYDRVFRDYLPDTLLLRAGPP